MGIVPRGRLGGGDLGGVQTLLIYGPPLQKKIPLKLGHMEVRKRCVFMLYTPLHAGRL